MTSDLFMNGMKFGRVKLFGDSGVCGSARTQ